MNPLDDLKVRAMYDLLQQLKKSSYDDALRKVYNMIEKRGIPFLLDLPEGMGYKYYCDQLDSFLVNAIKNCK